MPRLIPFSLHAAGRVAVLLLLAAGTASADCRWPYWGPMATVHTASAVSRVSAIDLTGDGKADLVATGPTQAFVILNNGGGAFGTATPIADGTFSEHLAADFTGDRKTDLLLGDLTTNAPALRLLPGAGNGTFGAPQTFAMPFGPVRLATADFNGDALRDVAIASDTAVAVMLRTASGFSESARVTLAAKPSTLIAPDLDDDGFDDVIAGSINSNLLEAFFGLGNGTLQPVVKLPANTTNDLVPADFDGNGLPDLASSGGYWGVFSRNLTGRLFAIRSPTGSRRISGPSARRISPATDCWT